MKVSKTLRNFGLQVTIVAIVVGIFYGLWHNMVTNLNRQNIASGFGFLDETAGFGIIFHLIAYNEQNSYLRVFIIGILNTLYVSFIGIGIATVIGFIMGISRLSNNVMLRFIARTYVEIMRNLPLLLQIFFWYFAVLRSLPPPRQSISFFNSIFLNNRGLYIPSLEFNRMAIILLVITGICLVVYAMSHSLKFKSFIVLRRGILYCVPVLILLMFSQITLSIPSLSGFNFQGGSVFIPEMLALIIALASYTAAFIAEIVRAGLMSVNRGQIEAATALGLNVQQRLRLIIIPQALRVIIPPLTNQYLNLTKNSSLATAIAFPDLVAIFAGTVLNQTGQAVEVISMTMAVYLTISLSISFIMQMYQAWHAKWGSL